MKMLMEKGAEALAGLVRWVRGERVMLDADLARLYGVTTRALNQAVRRNPRRFPPAFILHIDNEDLVNLKSQNVTSSLAWGGRRKPAFGFTEHGALMVANVLSSKEAVKMSLYVVRAFIKQRKLLTMQSDILKKLAQMDAKLLGHDEALRAIWNELQPLLAPIPVSSKRRIGFGE